MGKYLKLRPRDFPSAQAIFSISQSYTSSIVLPVKARKEELILCIGLAAGDIFSRIAW